MRRRAPRSAAVLALIAGALTTLPGVPASATPDPRPNVVVVMTDDQRFDSLTNCLPSYGAPDGPGSVACMPNVRSLFQAQGVTFEQSFATTSVCCPSRSSFLTGLYAHNHGVLTNEKPVGGFEGFSKIQDSTLATWLHGAGYRTSLIGKYLNGYYGPETPPGWDDWHAAYGTSSSSYQHFKLVENGVVNEYSRTYHTTVLGQKAVGFIQGTPASQPLFLYFAPHAPHYPYTPAKGDGQRYSEQPPWRPPSFEEPDVTDKPEFFQALAVPTADFVAKRDQDQRRQLLTLLEVDRQVASIVAALGPRAGNTLFVFTSDNGLLWGEHRYFEEKGCQYEECARVPLVVRYDPLTQGLARVDSTHPALNIDLAPTILEAAGVTGPDGMDGRSLLPLLAGSPPTDWRTAVFGENFSSLLPTAEKWPPSNTFVETFDGDPAGAGHKYTESCDRADHAVPCTVTTTELYDEAADPYELCNLLSPTGCGPAPPPGLASTLAGRLHELQASHPPPIEVDSPPPSSTAPVTIGFDGAGLSRFRCSLDGADPAPCASPVTPPGQSHGPHELTVQGDGPGGTSAPATVRWWISDRLPATPSFTGTPPSPGGFDATFSFADTEAGVTFRCALDDEAATACPSPTTLHGLALGAHTFSVFAHDGADNRSLPATFGWTVQDDLTPPVLAMKRPAADELLATRRLLAQWSATDAGSGMDRFEVTGRVGLSGAPVVVQTGLATTYTVDPEASGTYCFRVTAFDREANSKTGPERCAAVPLDDRGLAPTGPVMLTAPSGAFDGTVTRLTGAGSATFTFTGRRYGVLFRKGPDAGKARITLDDGTPKLVDLYGSTPKNLWWTQAFGGSGAHTVRIAWTGQKSSASTGTDVPIDGVSAIADAAPQPA